MFKKRCKIGLLVYCLVALCFYFVLVFNSKLPTGNFHSPGQWIILLALFGPYLFLIAMLIWPKQKTTAQCVVLMVSAMMVVFLDVLKSSALLTPDPNVMEIFVLLMTGKLQLGIILIGLVVIFVFIRKDKSHKMLE